MKKKIIIYVCVQLITIHILQAGQQSLARRLLTNARTKSNNAWNAISNYGKTDAQKAASRFKKDLGQKPSVIERLLDVEENQTNDKRPLNALESLITKQFKNERFQDAYNRSPLLRAVAEPAIKATSQYRKFINSTIDAVQNTAYDQAIQTQFPIISRFPGGKSMIKRFGGANEAIDEIKANPPMKLRALAATVATGKTLALPVTSAYKMGKRTYNRLIGSDLINENPRGSDVSWKRKALAATAGTAHAIAHPVLKAGQLSADALRIAGKGINAGLQKLSNKVTDFKRFQSDQEPLLGYGE